MLLEYARRKYVPSKHPLHALWRQMRSRHDFSSEWQEFVRFAEDVGVRPHNCFLKKSDPSRPYGPDNWCWKQKVGC